nr:PaaI family thioesterase [Bryobacter sp.]
MAAAAETVNSPCPTRAKTHSGCFACGQDNPEGLKLRFQRGEAGVMRAEWRPGPLLEGFRGIVHGGVVSTALDEAMSKAVAASGVEALTAELRVRYRQPVRSEAAYELRGWIVMRSRRLVRTEAVLLSADGTEHAHGWADFLVLPAHARASSRATAPST